MSTFEQNIRCFWKYKLKISKKQGPPFDFRRLMTLLKFLRKLCSMTFFELNWNRIIELKKGIISDFIPSSTTTRTLDWYLKQQWVRYSQMTLTFQSRFGIPQPRSIYLSITFSCITNWFRCLWICLTKLAFDQACHDRRSLNNLWLQKCVHKQT